jgi:hypothetical protein
MKTAIYAALAGLLFLTAACSHQATSDKSAVESKDWIELFNGKDIKDWTPKFSHAPMGENLLNTFRVEKGVLRVVYDNYDEFGGRFGHLFHNSGPYSYYLIQAEYRFVGEQVKGGPEWAKRNNGVMFHTQHPSELPLEEGFPRSMEMQLLGGDGVNARTTANVCTPGTKISINGEPREDHCIESSSATYHGDQWVTIELLVHGSELVQHYVNGDLVMEYHDLILDDGTPLDSGFIAIQAETAPTEFRRIRLLNLEGCMDKKAKNYRSYFVKNAPESCIF